MPFQQKTQQSEGLRQIKVKGEIFYTGKSEDDLTQHFDPFLTYEILFILSVYILQQRNVRFDQKSFTVYVEKYATVY